MINTPIKNVRIQSMEELKKFSYRHGMGKEESVKTFCQNNGQIAYCDEHEQIWVTPYRSEIQDVLQEAGYEQYGLWVPFSNGEKVPECYAWLRKIADEENWAETYEKAKIVADEKGIKPVELEQKVQVKEIIGWYKDDHRGYCPMITIFLFNNSRDNIGTYILLDQKSILVCDEYGRTFLISVKTSINDIVNTLIDAGYTRTPNPEFYVKDRMFLEGTQDDE